MSTHNIPFSQYKKRRITLNCPKSAAKIFSKGLKNMFETALVNEPSVFEPLKFYCNSVFAYFLIAFGKTAETKSIRKSYQYVTLAAEVAIQ